jgi:hypothetical protein
MIEKIVSGGQTGADQGALDAAIEYGIPHAGWVPKGRRTEKGRLPQRYHLKEATTIDYEQRTELNVIDSDGTVIFTHGNLIGGSALTQQLAKKHRRPCLHIDLNEITAYKAVVIIRSWIEVRGIKILNVAGSRASEDPALYGAVKDILKSVLYPPPERISQHLPRTVTEAVERLISELPLKEKTSLARMGEHDLPVLDSSLGKYISGQFGLRSGNPDLMTSCRLLSKERGLSGDGASAVIIKELWKRLQETHKLRVV